MNLKLVVVQGKPEGKEIPLRIAKFLIGRGAECHLRPNSELISRHHCMFVMGENQVALRDLGSTNGTLVNGERIEGEVAIYHEDLVQVGPLGFRIVIEQPAVVPVEKQPLPAVAVPAAAVAVPAAAPAALAQAGTPGTTSPADHDFDKWLVPDHNPGAPNDGSTSPEDETVLLDKGELGEGQDTQHELPVPQPGQAPATDEVTLESGRKVKIGNAKAKIEKTRDDTSSAAAELLRRMMDRRSKKQ